MTTIHRTFRPAARLAAALNAVLGAAISAWTAGSVTSWLPVMICRLAPVRAGGRCWPAAGTWR